MFLAHGAFCREWAKGESTATAMEFDQPGQEADKTSQQTGQGEVIADIGRSSPSAVGAEHQQKERGNLPDQVAYGAAEPVEGKSL